MIITHQRIDLLIARSTNTGIKLFQKKKILGGWGSNKSQKEIALLQPLYASQFLSKAPEKGRSITQKQEIPRSEQDETTQEKEGKKGSPIRNNKAKSNSSKDIRNPQRGASRIIPNYRMNIPVQYLLTQPQQHTQQNSTAQNCSQKEREKRKRNTAQPNELLMSHSNHSRVRHKTHALFFFFINNSRSIIFLEKKKKIPKRQQRRPNE